MRNTGVRKTIDDLGRIVLPKEIRKSLGLGIRSAVDLYVDGEKLIITKTKNECIFCNSRDNLVEYKGKSGIGSSAASSAAAMHCTRGHSG